MQMAQHLGVSQAYKQDGVSQVQPRGVSMIMSSDTGGVPYGHVMPQLATLQIGSSVIKLKHKLPSVRFLFIYFFFAVHKSSVSVLSTNNYTGNADG